MNSSAYRSGAVGGSCGRPQLFQFSAGGCRGAWSAGKCGHVRSRGQAGVSPSGSFARLGKELRGEEEL